MCFSPIPSDKSLDIMLGCILKISGNFMKKYVSYGMREMFSRPKTFYSEKYFKVFKDFDTEYKLEHEKCS